MSAADAELLRQAAALHDVGKVGIPDAILRKPGRLDAEERMIMTGHTTIGAAILAGSSSPLIRLAESIALAHHERWDGARLSRTACAGRRSRSPRASAPSATSSTRSSPPGPTSPPGRCRTRSTSSRAERGRHFDPAVVDAFLALVPSLEPELLGPGDAEPQRGRRRPVAGGR